MHQLCWDSPQLNWRELIQSAFSFLLVFYPCRIFHEQWIKAKYERLEFVPEIDEVKRVIYNLQQLYRKLLPPPA